MGGVNLPAFFQQMQLVLELSFSYCTKWSGLDERLSKFAFEFLNRIGSTHAYSYKQNMYSKDEIQDKCTNTTMRLHCK